MQKLVYRPYTVKKFALGISIRITADNSPQKGVRVLKN